MLYKSTRGNSKYITASEGIIKGIAEDGGLYIPNKIPNIEENLESLANFSYKEVALYVLRKYLTDFTEEELKNCIDKAYDNKFSGDDIVNLRRVGQEYFLELYHGPTLAFKDMALAILPHLLDISLKKNGIEKEVVILTATSGDTGKAALEAFSNVAGIKVIVFYPYNGVSDIQKKQMITQKGENVLVVGIKGNFDDAQSGVKNIFNDKEYSELLQNKGYILSSANSINIGRLIPQIVYYVFSYLQLIKNKEINVGDKINVVVPTGNFGNILAGYYAKKMGIPIDKLICASNENNVLWDFINKGIYDTHRVFKITESPSMDIVVSSNLERLVYYLANENADTVKELMGQLKEKGIYKINSDMKDNLKDFYAGFANDEKTIEAIGQLYEESRYIMDTHTSVAYSVYKEYMNKVNSKEKTIIVSTASPFKFTRSVCRAMGIEDRLKDDFQLIDELGLYENVPSSIKDLKDRQVLHKSICEIEEIREKIGEFLFR